MEELNFVETTQGTPQGGIISPTLCNIALNGIEKIIKEANPNKKGISAGVHIIRYADDMIITSRTKEIAIKNKKILSEFLLSRGLELNEKKTLITNVKNGFDFLGFNIRRMLWNYKLNKETNQETVLIIKPSKKGIEKLKEKIFKITKNKNKPMDGIIREVNTILRG
jgi:RNA-directed DNA polymerase